LASFYSVGRAKLSIGASAKVFSYAERFDHHSTVSLKRVLKKSDAGIRIVTGRRTISRRVRWLRLDHLGVGGQWLWALGATSPGFILGHVAVPGFADYFRFVFLEYAWHQRGTYIGDYELK